MNRQTIEKAADNYAAKATPSYTNGDFDRHAIAEAFECGSDWRINSVWHDVEEKPNGMFVIIIDFGDEVGAEEFGLGMTADDLNGAKRWAYVSDLLPERKEETE